MHVSPRIAFFGSSLVSAYWNGAATYYRGILSALYRLGYRITFFEPDAYERQQNRDIPDPDYARVVVYSAESESGVHQALAQARDFDIVVKASGVGVFDELLENAVLEQRRPGQKVVFWDVDAPATLDRMAASPDDPFVKLIPRYDMILTYGGGDPVRRGYERLGARSCTPIYNALDPGTHFATEPDERFAASLSFLGNRMPDREQRVFEFFFTPASMLPKMRFVLGGSGWRGDAANLPNITYVGHVYTHDHNAFNSTPLAVLNISRQSMADYGFSPATRVFEAAGAGACIITDAWKGVELFLEPGRECLVAHCGQEAAEILSGLDNNRATAIGRAARKRVLAQHTYQHRAGLVHQRLTGNTAGEEARFS